MKKTMIATKIRNNRLSHLPFLFFFCIAIRFVWKITPKECAGQISELIHVASRRWIWNGIWDLRFGIWDSRFEIWDSRFEIWDLRFVISLFEYSNIGTASTLIFYFKNTRFYSFRKPLWIYWNCCLVYHFWSAYSSTRRNLVADHGLFVCTQCI